MKKIKIIKKDIITKDHGPRVPRERYVRVERRITQLEQKLDIRDLKLKVPASTLSWMSVEELIDLERRIQRIQKKLELSNDTNLYM